MFYYFKIEQLITTDFVCEGINLQIICPSDQLINVQNAFFGRLSSTICPNSQAFNLNCSSDSSFSIISNMCNGQNTCSVPVSYTVLGDPCHSTFKYAQVIYFCY